MNQIAHHEVITGTPLADLKCLKPHASFSKQSDSEEMVLIVTPSTDLRGLEPDPPGWSSGAFNSSPLPGFNDILFILGIVVDRIKTQTESQYNGQSSEIRVTSSIPVSMVTEKASTANLTVKGKALVQSLRWGKRGRRIVLRIWGLHCKKKRVTEP